MKQQPAQTLVANLKMLMQKTGVTTSEIAAKSGVSQRMIKYILDGERKPGVDVAGAIAESFGLTGWQLIMPSLPYDLAKNGQLEKLIEDFSHCNQASRTYILHVSEREAEYKSVEQ